MSYACKGITSNTIYEGREMKKDLFKLNASTVILDSHNNYKLTMTPVVKNGKPVLNHFNNPLKAYEIIRYAANKQGEIYVLDSSLPIYGYNKAVEAFEQIRRHVKPTRWQQQYYEDRPHLFELIHQLGNDIWCRIAYESIVPVVSEGKKATVQPNKKIGKATPIVETITNDNKRDDKIRKACDRAYKEHLDILDLISSEDLTYAIKYMNFDPMQSMGINRTKHPLWQNEK